MTKGRTRSFTMLAVLAMACAPPAAADAQQTVIIVRHAERADGGAGAAASAMTAPADPLLSAAGEARAARLASMLADAKIAAIYATEFRRTQDTGKPLAARLGLTVQAVSSKDVGALVDRLKSRHAKDTVLVIGHSNTIPDVIKALGGPAITMRDDEYDALYVLIPATGALTLIRY